MPDNQITNNPNHIDDILCIRHKKIPIATVLNMLADRITTNEILEAYPDLTGDNIKEIVEDVYWGEKAKEAEAKGFLSADESLSFIQDKMNEKPSTHS